MKLSRLALLLVVLIDVMGQGLIFPIVTTIVMEPSAGFLPLHTSHWVREFDYGLIIGVFFLSWFLGAAYISRLSDYIGRKPGILICLGGALTGYLLTIVALYYSNFVVLILGRAISGFTAANQPIAQAALVDISKDEQEKTRNMGMIVAAMSMGLIAGPLMAGVLTDKSFLGRFASLELPFYGAVALVVLNIVLIVWSYHEKGFKRRKIDFGPSEVFLTLWRVRARPAILRLSAVMFFMLLGLNAFYVFLDNYMFSRFQFDTLQNSMIMTVFGGTMALASGLLATPLIKRFQKTHIVLVTLVVMAVSILVFMLNPVADLSYLLLIPLVMAFGVIYPTMLTLFSAGVDATEQGWVMGVVIALYTLGTGSISLIGGYLMSLSINLPFLISIGSFIVAYMLVKILWRESR